MYVEINIHTKQNVIITVHQPISNKQYVILASKTSEIVLI